MTDSSLVILPIWDTLNAAWNKVSGSKKTFLTALLILSSIGFCFGVVDAVAKSFSPSFESFIQFIYNIVNGLCQIGIVYIGLQRAFDKKIDYSQMFYAFSWRLSVRLFILYLLQFLILMPIGLLIFAGVTLFDTNAVLGTLLTIGASILMIIAILRMFLSIGVILKLDENPWDAIKLSYYATRSNTLQLLAISIFQFLIIAISAIPLGVGLIWTLPFTYICYGMMYKTLQPNFR